VSTLEAFGFQWDGEPVHQRNRLQHYASALQTLEARALTFECSCSRLQLEDEIRYPGTCRERPAVPGIPTATRLRVGPGFIEFCDRIQGRYRQDVAGAVGDMILRRRDQVFAYLLAVVIDDAAQGVTHVVRGADLLDNTPRQIYLQRALGLSQPAYAHVPVLTEPDDSKLAKSRHSVRLAADSLLPQLLRVFSLLGLTPPESLAGAGLAQAWQWAIEHWNVRKVSSQLTVRTSNQQSLQ
jgi:glutamyl-Q tRNA(Asp) synthetase